MTIELDGLTIGHRRRILAADLRARAAPAALTVLLGPNGTGKTTLLRTVCGLIPPLGGRVLVDHTEVTRLDPIGRAHRLAAVLTGTRVPPTMRARDVVALGRHPHTAHTAHLRTSDHDAIDTALADVGARDLGSRRVGELSDGERQRVLLARALAQDTRVVVLDEPTAFLDAPGRRTLFALLARIAHERSRTVLLCTHEVDLARAHADHAWLFDTARRVRSGPPDDLDWSWLDS